MACMCARLFVFQLVLSSVFVIGDNDLNHKCQDYPSCRLNLDQDDEYVFTKVNNFVTRLELDRFVGRLDATNLPKLRRIEVHDDFLENEICIKLKVKGCVEVVSINAIGNATCCSTTPTQTTERAETFVTERAEISDRDVTERAETTVRDVTERAETTVREVTRTEVKTTETSTVGDRNWDTLGTRIFTIQFDLTSSFYNTPIEKTSVSTAVLYKKDTKLKVLIPTVVVLIVIFSCIVLIIWKKYTCFCVKRFNNGSISYRPETEMQTYM